MARTEETWLVEADGAALASELHLRLNVSHRQAKGLIDAGCVRVNDQDAAKYGTRLKVGDRVAVAFDPDRVYTALPRPSRSADSPLDILWEDKHLVFVNKPAGLLTVPAEKHDDPCLAEALTDHYRRRGFKRFQLFIAHRLDRYTSGVLVFAKTPEALNGLKRIFDAHHLRRVYKAILVGELPENAGTLSDHLVERKSLRMSVVPEGSRAKKDLKGAKLAVTHYRVLERLPGHTVVEVKLETGRRNQIRVQFAERGFPLLGDLVYGSPSPLLDRQALHAELLGFRHPVNEDNLTVTAPMPADLERALKALRTAQRVVRAQAGETGEAGLYRPKITKERKHDRIQRAERFGEAAAETRQSPEAPDESASRKTAVRKPAVRAEMARPRRATESGSAGSDRPRRAAESRGTGSDRPRRAVESGSAGSDRPRRAAEPRSAGSDRPRRAAESRSVGSDRPRRAAESRNAGSDRPRRAAEPRSVGSDRPRRAAEPRSAGSDRPRRAAESRSAGSDRPRSMATGPAASTSARRPDKPARKPAAKTRKAARKRD
jgi:23S rRNA pseudouridine1911/1915/1917 synthase